MAGCAALPRCVENRTDQNSTRRSAAWSGLEVQLGDFEQEGLGIDPGLPPGLQLGQNLGLGWGQHAIEAAENGEGQDNLAVFRRLVIAPEQVGDQMSEERDDAD